MLNKGMFTSNTDMWETPQELFDELDREFHFTLDVCRPGECEVREVLYTRSKRLKTGLDTGGDSLYEPSLR